MRLVCRRSMLILIAAVLAGLSACAARGGLSGGLTTNLDTPIPALHTAVLSAVRGAGVTVNSESSDIESLLVKASYADETPLTIHGQRLTEQASSLSIQVGVFGDATRQQHMLDAIKAELSP